MAKRDWKPRKTYVLILGLGLSDWEDPDDPTWRRHQTLAEYFLKAGVPEEQVLFWEDEEGTPEQVRTNLPAFLAETAEDSLFIVYYAGHGDPGEDEEFAFCHPDYDDDWNSGTELFDIIEENFWGSQVLILADCCYSGLLARLVEDREPEFGYGVLTSATADIESTGNWTFTDCILSALRGEADIDTDNDGAISFQELCDYVLTTMEEQEDQPADFSSTEYFDPSFRLATVKKPAFARKHERKLHPVGLRPSAIDLTARSVPALALAGARCRSAIARHAARVALVAHHGDARPARAGARSLA